VAGDAPAASTSPRLEVYSTLLRNRSFRRLFLAMSTSSLGDWIGVLAIIALTESLLGEGTRAAAFAVSGVMVARVIPTLVLGPIAGVFVDRWDRKRTLIGVDVGRGILMAVLAFSGSFLELFFLTLFIEMLSMMFAPARDATIPNLVEKRQLVQANQIALFVTYGTLPIGGMIYAAITGFATTFIPGWFDATPEVLAILLNALTFFASAILLVGMAVPASVRESRLDRVASGRGTWEQLKEGFEFVLTRPKMRALVIGVMAAAFAAGVLFAVGKLFVSVVGAGQTGWGLLVAATGVGMAAGLLVAAWASERWGKDRVFAPGVAMGGAAASIAALMPRAELAAFWALVLGAGAGVAFVTGYTLLQEEAKDELRGRAFAAFHTGVRAALFIALVAAPFAVGVIGQEPVGGLEYVVGGVRITMIVGGLVAVAGAVWCGRQMAGIAGGEPIHVRELIETATEVFGVQRPGLFVVFEGGEGSGKSTQVERLRDTLRQAGLDVLVTREPGGTEVGESIRSVLLDPRSVVDPRTEALLHAAVRAQHVEEVIRPALAAGKVVISDRYVDSSIVYQGVARGLGEDEIVRINRWGTEGLVPDLVVVLDIGAEEGLRRARERGDWTRYDEESVEFHERVNRAFLQRAAGDGDRYLVVDGSLEPDEVHERVAARVLEMLGRELGYTTGELRTVTTDDLELPGDGTDDDTPEATRTAGSSEDA
jgi:dTMP kinase